MATVTSKGSLDAKVEVTMICVLLNILALSNNMYMYMYMYAYVCVFMYM